MHVRDVTLIFSHFYVIGHKSASSELVSMSLERLICPGKPKIGSNQVDTHGLSAEEGDNLREAAPRKMRPVVDRHLYLARVVP